MDLNEFSAGFDILLNSYSSGASIECDEYEKSLFLTKSQEETALGLYNGRNPLGESFEQTEEVRRYLSNLIEEVNLEPITTSNGNPLGISSKSKFFTLPNGSEGQKPAVWFITYESVTVSDGQCGESTTLEVVPVRQDEYHRIKKNPFRGANNHRALRLDLSDGNIEIVSDYTVTKYYVRYLRRLNPIIVANLDGNEIGGKSEPTECELPDTLHQKILERAVALAYQSKAQPVQQKSN